MNFWSTKLASFLFLIGTLSFSLAHAQTSSFEDSKASYKTLKNQFDADELSIRQVADGKTTTIDQQIQKLESDFQNCSTFDCRKQTRNQITQLESDKKDIKTQADIAVMEKAKVFVKKAQEVAVDAFVFETLNMAASDAKLEHFVSKSVTACGRADFLDYYISPSRAMTCKQMNVEFKYGDKYYKLSTAVGLQYGGSDHSGNSQGIDTETEVNTIDAIFSLSTAEFLKDLTATKAFWGGPGMRPDWSQVIFDYQGSARYYVMYNPYWVGRYTVSIESY